MIVVPGSGPWDGPPGPSRSTAEPLAQGTDVNHRARSRAAYERLRRRQQADRIERTRLPEPPLEPLGPLPRPSSISGPSR